MEECTAPETFDYFSGSEISFALSFTAIGLYVLSEYIVDSLLLREHLYHKK